MNRKADWPETGFGTRLRELREKAGMTQQQLADAVDIHVVSVARLEAGRQVPAWPLVVAVAKVLGVDCTQFLSDQPAEKRPRGRPRRTKQEGE